jgi:hypothetical protein
MLVEKYGEYVEGSSARATSEKQTAESKLVRTTNYYLLLHSPR